MIIIIIRILNFLNFDHVCNIIISNNKNLSLSVSTQIKRNLAILFQVMKLTQLDFHITLTKLFLIFLHMFQKKTEKVYFVKGLGFVY